MTSAHKPSILEFLRHMWDPAWLRRWARPYHETRGLKAFGVRQLEVFVLTIRSLHQEEITLRAAALTYRTLLSIVPLMAVGFALFKAFGGLQKLEEPLRNLLLENLAAGRGEEVGQWLDKFISNINAGAIAGVGVLVLFYSAIGLLTEVEGSFNRIWGIRRGRPIVNRIFIYWGLITLAPPLVGLSVSMTAQLQSSSFMTTVVEWLPFGLGRLLVSLTSALATCVAFVVSYIIVPNTSVRIRAALLGGIVAGLLWNVTKALFISFTASSIKYSAIYGALGALPLLMIWMYLSWLIVLLGVTYTYASQSIHTQGLELASLRMSQTFRETLSARIVAEVAHAFHQGQPPRTAEDLSNRLGTASAVVRQVLEVLVDHGVLAMAQRKDEEEGYLPGRSIQELSLAEVMEVLRHKDGTKFELAEIADGPQGRAAALLAEAEEAAQQVLRRRSLRALVVGEGEGEGA